MGYVIWGPFIPLSNPSDPGLLKGKEYEDEDDIEGEKEEA